MSCGELASKEFLVLMDQYNIEICSCFFRLLPLCSSTFHQSIVEIAQNGSEDNLWISKIQSLHLLLEVDDHDEEEYSVVLTLGKRRAKGIFSYAHEPHIAFCSIFVHPLFPVFEPLLQIWVIFVRRRPCVYDTFRFESPPLRWKKIEFGNHDNWTSRMSRTTRGKNNIVRVSWEGVADRRPATPSQEHGLCPPLGFQQKGRLQVQRWGFRCLGV